MSHSFRGSPEETAGRPNPGFFVSSLGGALLLLNLCSKWRADHSEFPYSTLGDHYKGPTKFLCPRECPNERTTFFSPSIEYPLNKYSGFLCANKHIWRCSKKRARNIGIYTYVCLPLLHAESGLFLLRRSGPSVPQGAPSLQSKDAPGISFPRKQADPICQVLFRAPSSPFGAATTVDILQSKHMGIFWYWSALDAKLHRQI